MRPESAVILANDLLFSGFAALSIFNAPFFVDTCRKVLTD